MLQEGVAPLVYIISILFIPLPILYYRSKYGRKNGALILLAAIAALLVAFNGVALNAAFFMKYLIIGFAVGEFLELNVSMEKTVIGACGLALTMMVVGGFVYASVSGTDILGAISGDLKKISDIIADKLRIANWIEEDQVVQFKDDFYYLLTRITPVKIAAETLFETWLCLAMAKPLFKAKNLPYPDFGDLAVWRAPDYLVWVAIGCGFMPFLQNRLLLALGLSGLIVILKIYFFQGMAVVSDYFGKKAFSNMSRLAFYGLIIIADIAHVVVAGIGFFDIWMNFRKLDIAKEKKQ